MELVSGIVVAMMGLFLIIMLIIEVSEEAISNACQICFHPKRKHEGIYCTKCDTKGNLLHERTTTNV